MATLCLVLYVLGMGASTEMMQSLLRRHSPRLWQVLLLLLIWPLITFLVGVSNLHEILNSSPYKGN